MMPMSLSFVARFSGRTGVEPLPLSLFLTGMGEVDEQDHGQIPGPDAVLGLDGVEGLDVVLVQGEYRVRGSVLLEGRSVVLADELLQELGLAPAGDEVVELFSGGDREEEGESLLGHGVAPKCDCVAIICQKFRLVAGKLKGPVTGRVDPPGRKVGAS